MVSLRLGVDEAPYKKVCKLIHMDREQATVLIDHLERIAVALERIADQLEPGPKPADSVTPDVGEQGKAAPMPPLMRQKGTFGAEIS